MTAREFAIKAHGDQKYGDHPYVTHLDQVHAVLVEFGCVDQDILTAAYLHDILEDTDCNYILLKLSFGERVTLLVNRVTSCPGKNRSERNKATYSETCKYPGAIILKLADRIANVRVSRVNAPDKFQMYLKEYPEFRRVLIRNALNNTLSYRCGEDRVMFGMWEELDCLMVEGVG